MDRMQHERLEQINFTLYGESTGTAQTSPAVLSSRLLSKFSPEQRQQAEFLLQDIDVQDSATVSLCARGVKALSCIPLIHGSESKKQVLSGISKVLSETDSKLKILFTEESGICLPGGRNNPVDVVTAWILNIPAAVELIRKERSVFQSVLEGPVSAEALTAAIAAQTEEGTKVLSDGVALGILFGYGSQNAIHYQKVEFLKIYSSQEQRYKEPLGYDCYLNKGLMEICDHCDERDVDLWIKKLEKDYKLVGGQSGEGGLISVPRFYARTDDAYHRQFIAKCISEINEIEALHRNNGLLKDFLSRAVR